MGWLLRKKHLELKSKSRSLDLSDLTSDPIVMLDHKYYWIIYLTFAMFIPMAIPVYLWQETWWRSFQLTYVCRTLVTLHGTWLINSAAHMFSERPFDPKIAPADNKFLALYGYGEGYHNYHHTFPWDYKASETGHTRLNMTRKFIELNNRIGLAYDLKSASEQLVEQTFKNNSFKFLK
jgi:stearoyl-CoA desaturase (delta-9 desaturase)